MNTETTINLTQVERLLAPVAGEYAWLVQCGAGRVLTIEFGDPHLHIVEPRLAPPETSAAVREGLARRIVVPTGEWHLFVWDGLWQVETASNSCSRTGDDLDHTQVCLSRLEGQKLVSSRYVPDAGEWIFEFDLGGKLTIASSGDPEDDNNWTMFRRDGSYFVCEAPGKFTAKGFD